MRAAFLFLCASFAASAQQCVTSDCTAEQANCSEVDATYTSNPSITCTANCNGYYSVWSSNASAEQKCCLGNAQCSNQHQLYEACVIANTELALCEVEDCGAFWMYGSGDPYACQGCMTSAYAELQGMDTSENTIYQGAQTQCDAIYSSEVASAGEALNACLAGCQ